jgi:DNA-binding NtrC family response regulator
MHSNIVLCVDDDSTVLAALRIVLGKILGSEVIVEIASSGKEALLLCAELEAEGREVSVVVSDFLMPQMRGDELLVRIHQQYPNTVNIMLTGQSDLEGVKRAINQANLYRFLEKPFNNADLVLTVRSALKSYNQHREQIEKIDTLQRRIAELEAKLGVGVSDQ